MSSPVKAELSKFGENTTLTGIPNYLRSEGIFLKSLWIICILACTGALINDLRLAIQEILEWPTTTKYGEGIGETTTFPDITICNLDLFSENMPEEPPELYFRGLSMYKAMFEQSFVNDTSTPEDRKKAFLRVLDELISIPGFILNLNKTFPGPETSLLCPNFLTSCTSFTSDWSAEENDCASYFYKRWNENYFFCHTLRSAQLKRSTNLTTRGLNLVLNVGPPSEIQVPYKPTLSRSQSRGVRISIHSPGTPPDLKRGFDVAPGTENIVNIVQTDRERLNKPHNRLGCTERKWMPDSPKESYNHDLCIEYCKQLVIYKNCLCMTHLLTVPLKYAQEVEMCGNASSVIDSIPALNYSGANKLKIQTVIMKVRCSLLMLENTSCEEECLAPCNEKIFDSYLTTSSWPQPSVTLDIFKQFILDQRCMATHSSVRQRYAAILDYYMNISQNPSPIAIPIPIPIESFRHIRESFLQIKFIIKQNFPFYLSDSPTYSWGSILGMFGGTLSLWMGVSVGTSVEIIALLYSLARVCVKKRKRKSTSDVAQGRPSTYSNIEENPGANENS